MESGGVGGTQVVKFPFDLKNDTCDGVAFEMAPLFSMDQVDTEMTAAVMREVIAQTVPGLLEGRPLEPLLNGAEAGFRPLDTVAQERPAVAHAAAMAVMAAAADARPMLLQSLPEGYPVLQGGNDTVMGHV